MDGPGIDSQWGGAKFSAPVQTSPGAHPAYCTMGTGPFLGVKSGQAVTLTPHPLLVPWSLKGRAIPLLPLWAVRPVQSLSACTRVHFNYFTLSLMKTRQKVHSVIPGHGQTKECSLQIFFFLMKYMHNPRILKIKRKSLMCNFANREQTEVIW